MTIVSRNRRALFIMISSLLPLVACSLNFNVPWDKSAADNYQTTTTRTKTAPVQPENQPSIAVSPSAVEDGRKWTRYMTDDNDIRYFCDEETITQPSKNTVQMWRKREFPAGSAQRQIVTYDEIDCKKGRDVIPLSFR